MSVKFNSFLRDIEKDLKKSEKKLLSKAASHLKKKMKDKARVFFKKQTGNLLKGIRSASDGQHRAIVGAGRPARQAHLLEFGTVDRTVKKNGRFAGHVSPKPFIGPTFEEEAGAVEKIMSEPWL